MAKKQQAALSRRERQIMDVLYAGGGGAKVSAVLAALPDPPSYSSVRALLGVLEGKGHVRHRVERGKFVYFPTTSRKEAAKTALRRVLETFFGGSLEGAVATHLADPAAKVSEEDLKRLAALIRAAKERGE